jgi:L-threonine kinase
MDYTGVGECCGSFGELLQGVLPNGHKFLVNCRIRNRSIVRLNLAEPHYAPEKEEAMVRSHQHWPKTYKGLRNFLADLGRRDDFLFEIDSDIPVGKGLSSSTADMVAGIRALASVLSIKLKNDYVSRMLSEIEPNDGLHFDNTSAYLHTEGRLIANFSYVPPFRILGLDAGGTFDTVVFNTRPITFTAGQQERYQHLLKDISAALEQRELNTVAMIATESGRLWQTINPKREFEQVEDLARSLGALGVLNTHSGTYLGVLFADDPSLDEAACAAEAAARLPHHRVGWFQTTGYDSSKLVSLDKAQTRG